MYSYYCSVRVHIFTEESVSSVSMGHGTKRPVKSLPEDVAQIWVNLVRLIQGVSLSTYWWMYVLTYQTGYICFWLHLVRETVGSTSDRLHQPIYAALKHIFMTTLIISY